MGLGLFWRVPDVKNQIAMQVAVSLCGPIPMQMWVAAVRALHGMAWHGIEQGQVCGRRVSPGTAPGRRYQHWH